MQRDNAEGSSGPKYQLSDEQQAVLVGTLLGDGCLAKHGRYHRLHVKHKGAHRSLVEFKHGVFGNLATMPVHEFVQRLHGKSYPCLQFATRTSPLLTEWHSVFYRGSRKIVPANIGARLRPLAFAVWLMDDGAADYAGITLQTHCFSVCEVQLLADVLRQRFGLATSVRKNKRGSIVYVAAASVATLHETWSRMLSPSFVIS